MLMAYRRAWRDPVDGMRFSQENFRVGVGANTGGTS
jgi:hypothetical protein